MAASLVLSVAAVSSVGGQVNGNQPPTIYNTLSDYLSAMRAYPMSLPPLKKDSIAAVSAGNPLCTVVTQDDPTSELASFNPNAGLLWPGALLQFQGLPSGTLTDVPITARTPITVSLSGVALRDANGQPMLVPQPVVVTNPSGSGVETARLTLLQSPVAAIPNFFYSAKRSYSLESGLFQAGMSASWLGNSVRASLQSSSYSQKQNYTAKLTQQFYTFTVDSKDSPAAWFSGPRRGFPGVKIADLTPYSDPQTNPVVVIRSVTYGRMALLSISSSEDSTAVQQAVDATISWSTGSGSASLSDVNRHVFQNSEIKLWVYGGGWPADAPATHAGEQTVHAIELQSNDKAAELARFLRPSGPGEIRWGLPISYRADFIGSGAPAAVQLATTFTVCKPPPPIITLTGVSVTFNTTSDDKDHDTHFDFSFVNNGENVASVAYRGDETFGNNSQHTSGLQLNRQFRREEIGNTAAAIHVVDRNGNDGWHLSMTIHLRWSDGTQRDLNTGELILGDRDFQIHVIPAR